MERPAMQPTPPDGADALTVQERVAMVLAVAAIVGAWTWLAVFVASH